MTANEAKIISEKNAIKVDEIVCSILAAAEHGENSLVIPRYLSNETIQLLLKDGYNIRLANDPMGLEVIIISW